MANPAPAALLATARSWSLKCLLIACLTSLVGCASLPDSVHRPESQAWPAPEQTWLGRLAHPPSSALQLADAVRTSNGLGADAMNTVNAVANPRADSGFQLLDNAAAAFGARLALIEAAQRTLDIQSYAIHADDSTDQLFEAIHRAVARGVRVRILLDDFNTSGKDAQVLALAFVPGIELRLFNPLPGTRSAQFLRILGSLHDIPRIQRRMHNKIFVADNAMAIAGGRNLGDTYFGRDNSNNFVDLDVLASGRIVRNLSASFDLYWNNRLAFPAQALINPAELRALKKLDQPRPDALTPDASTPATADDRPVPAPVPTALSRPALPSTDLTQLNLVWAPSVMLVDQPSKLAADTEAVEETQDTLIDGLLQLVSGARRDLLIVSPYFVPGPRMMAQFAAIRQKGVRVRVLTNSLASNDAPAAHVGYARYRPGLLAMGVELYEMRAEQKASLRVFGSSSESLASLHSKMVVVDEAVVVIGSMNLDLRSQLQNTEVALAIRSSTLARQAKARLEPTLLQGAWRLAQDRGGLLWQAPQDSGLQDTRHEPDASLGLRLLVKLLAPFAPDEML